MFDEIDRGLVHALHLDGRAAFRRIAEVLGVSTQTVTRRYRRLRADAGLRVVAIPDPAKTGSTQWLVRLTAAPATAADLAHSLARRPDTSWVRLISGGTEIVALVTTPAGGTGSPSLLLHDVPRTTSVTAVSAHAVLHTYLGGPTTWPGRVAALTSEQQDRLLSGVPAPAPSEPQGDGKRPPTTSSPEQRALLEVLRRDGRASYNDLAAATGWSPATIARHLTEQREQGTIYFDVDLDDAHLGVGSRTLLWLAVTPAHLERTASAMAGHAELAFVATTTGTTNIVAQALAPDAHGLHRYLTGPLSTLEGVHAVETTPVLHTLKGAANPIE